MGHSNPSLPSATVLLDFHPALHFPPPLPKMYLMKCEIEGGTQPKVLEFQPMYENSLIPCLLTVAVSQKRSHTHTHTHKPTSSVWVSCYHGQPGADINRFLLSELSAAVTRTHRIRMRICCFSPRWNPVCVCFVPGNAVIHKHTGRHLAKQNCHFSSFSGSLCFIFLIFYFYFCGMHLWKNAISCEACHHGLTDIDRCFISNSGLFICSTERY